MTAEIAIMNKEAIALAADSAVTIGGGAKVYNTASKLFALSKYHPVGVMFFNNAQYMGMPWEMVIKQYRECLKTEAFDHLSDYASHFIAFLQDHSAFSNPRVEENHFREVVSRYFRMMVRSLVQFLNAPITSVIRPTQVQVDVIVDKFIDHHHYNCTGHDILSTWTQYDIENCILQHDWVITDIIDEVFGKRPISYKAINQLKEIAMSFFTRNTENEWHSGVVIAGYGEKDLFPALTSFITEGSFDGKLKLHPYEECFIDYDTPAALIPFAQDVMVHTFVKGIDPLLLEAFHDFLDRFTERFVQVAQNSIRALIPAQQLTALVKNLADAGREAAVGFRDRLDDVLRSDFIDPVLGALDVIPKDELALVAESLVSLTSFKQRISIEKETVGGPIDVAVITKGDGFVWIKRKAYFDRDLNHAFFANYFRDLSGG